MAAITVTAANVVAQSDAIQQKGTAGATITAGQSIYIDSSDSNKIKLADADAQASGMAVGISLHAALSGQPISYIVAGSISFGSGVLVSGEAYFVHTTAGGIGLFSDVLSGDYICLLGLASSTALLQVHIYGPGIVRSA